MAERDSYQVSLKLLLKNGAGQTLVLKASGRGSFSGFYDLPGGRIDVEEFTVPLADVIRREVAEELGTVAFNVDPKPVAVGRHLIAAKSSADRDTHVLYLFFEARYVSGDIQISDEHESIQWVDLQAIELGRYFKSGILEGVQMYLSR